MCHLFIGSCHGNLLNIMLISVITTVSQPVANSCEYHDNCGGWSNYNAKQKHLGCKKWRGQSEAAVI